MKTIILVIILFLAVNINAQLYRPQKVDIPDTVFSVSFVKDELGVYNDEELQNDFDEIKWVLTKERCEIVRDDVYNKVLRVKYPKGSVGPKEGGIQFVRSLPPNDEYYLDYFLLVENGFDFNKGGKLPGLTSGGSKFTGGVHPENGEGWSARYMWTEGGKLIVYLYYFDMKSKYGDHLDLKGVKLSEGKWHRLTQHIIINSGNKHNGSIEVWFDEKKVVNERGLRLRINDLGMIDSFYFSTFHGGATKDWAPKNDSFIRFTNITVSKIAPDFLTK